MIRTIHFSLTLLIVPLLAACTSEATSKCPFPPKEFSESDLVGTWGGDIDKPWDSMIIILEDGRYKQLIDVESQKFKYESAWKPWHVTYSDKGLPYLYLEGFFMCAYWWSIDCRTRQSSITPIVGGDTKDPIGGEYYWYDGCQKKWTDTSGAGVFMVFGIERASVMPPRRIVLVPFTKSSDSSTGPSYRLRQP